MTGKPFSQDDDRILIESYRRYDGRDGWAQSASALLGRSSDTISRRKRILVGNGTLTEVRAPDAPPIDTRRIEQQPPVDPVVAQQERIERIREARAEAQAYKEVAGERSLRAMFDKLFRDVVETIDPPPKYKAPRALRDSVRESVLFNWTDWHYAEGVDPERVRGHNAYNQAIARARVLSVVENGRGILSRLRRGGYEFPRAVVAANGDLVTGSIHELEKYSDGKTIIESVAECGYLLAEAVRNVAADFEQVDVYCTVGNHGRLPDARRMEQKAPLRNWDAAVYFFAQAVLRDCKNVTVTIPNSYAIAYDVAGLNVLQSHGHQIKSWMGVPWYGIERHVSRVTSLEAKRGQAPDICLFGHFHTASSMPLSGGETFVNGSLIGGTEYSVNELAKSDKPTQWLLGVHPEHGVTHRWPVYPAPDVTASAA